MGVIRTTFGRLAVSGLVAALTVLVATFVVNTEFDRRVDSIPRVEVAGLASPQGSARNFLLVGSDSREFVGDDQGATESFGTTADTGPQRADTMMIVHAQPGGGFVVSMPRDLWVDVPGLGGAKLNAAYHDGPSKVVETISSNFGIPIHHYLEVDFETFTGLVDAIGGVDMFFDVPTRDTVSGLSVPWAPACITLDGQQALGFVRARNYEEFHDGEWVTDPTADIGRMSRQQLFMRRLAAQTVTTVIEEPLRATDVADAGIDLLTADTDLSGDDMRVLLQSFRSVQPDDPASLEMLTLPWEAGTSNDGQSVLFVDEAAAAEVFERLRDPGRAPAAGDTVAPGSVSVRVLNGTSVDFLAANTASALALEGFVTVGSGDAESKPVELTEIRYRPGAEAEARTVAGYLAGVGVLVEDPTLSDADVVVVLGTDFSEVVPSTGTGMSTPDTTAPPGGDSSEEPLPTPGC